MQRLTCCKISPTVLLQQQANAVKPKVNCKDFVHFIRAIEQLAAQRACKSFVALASTSIVRRDATIGKKLRSDPTVVSDM
jgi:hypothetical protein